MFLVVIMMSWCLLVSSVVMLLCSVFWFVEWVMVGVGLVWMVFIGLCLVLWLLFVWCV